MNNNKKDEAWLGDFRQVRQDLEIALKNLNFGKELAEQLGLPESRKSIYEALCKAVEVTQQAINIYDESKSQN